MDFEKTIYFYFTAKIYQSIDSITFNVIIIISYSKICKTTKQCINGWVCKHRWPEIRKMIRFRNAVGNATVHGWCDNPDAPNQCAFCRGTRGMIAFNYERFDLNAE